MKHKLIIIIICMLLIGTVLPVTGTVIKTNNTASSSMSGNTLYVGGSGLGNYTVIQDAIDNASDGDTVFVYDDISPYYENVKVNKSINLIGENRETTVIDDNGPENVVSITADWINISGFTIRNTVWSDAGIGIRANYSNITGNIISNNYYGIRLLDSSCNNIITDNYISNNYKGIFLGNSIRNTIKGNNITSEKEGYGIILDSFSNNNTLTDNIISDGLCGISIEWYSSSNIITGNNITSNNKVGISLAHSSNYNIIYHNNFINNGENVGLEDGSINTWDDGKYGNYWSDYEERYPDAKPLLFKPWMWDTPYEINGGNKDNCPLIEPWPKSKPRTIQKDIASYSSYLLRFLEQFPMLRYLLVYLLEGGNTSE